MKTKQPKPKAPEPPEHLSERSQQLWRAFVPSRARSIGRMTLLQSALESLDRAEQARLAIATEGLTTTTKTTGAVHIHPLVKVERESRQQFSRIWEQLHFAYDAKLDGQHENPWWTGEDE